MFKKIILILTILTVVIPCQISSSMPISGIEDLFKLVRTAKILKNCDRLEFLRFIKNSHMDHLMPFIKQLPYEKRVGSLLEIAVRKKLLKPTEILRFNKQLIKIDHYDDVLATYIRNSKNSTKFKTFIAADLKKIRNESLAGKVHPRTGVPFTKDGFPIFNSVHDVELPEYLYKATDREQFTHVTNSLWNEIQHNPKLAEKFSKKQLEQIRAGHTPTGYTWHHHETPGKMQLVKTAEHQATGHTGGKSIWGGGKECR